MRTTLLTLLCLFLAAMPAAGQEIITAATEGDLDRIRELITTDPAAITAADDRHCTALHFAVDEGRAEVVAYLLDAGAQLEARDIDGDTPLHWAACKDHIAVIDLLLDRGAEIDALNHGHATPVMYATQRLKYANVEKLVARGADLGIPDDYGRTPLIWTARERGDLEMARLLLRLGADVNATDRFGSSALDLATWRGFRTLVGILLDAGARVDMYPGMDQRLLASAAAMGLDRLYGTLLGAGTEVDVSPRGYVQPLHIAAGGGSELIVRDMLERGAVADAVDMYGWTPLHHAADRGRTAVVRVLAAADPVVDRMTLSGRTPLGLARGNGNAETVRALEELGHTQAEQEFPRRTGAWLGQGDPPAQPEPFALDVVTTAWGQHGGVTFTADGREAFWPSYTAIPDSGYTDRGTILTSRLVDGRWTTPAMASFARQEVGDDVPFMAPDGQRLFFLSGRPLEPGGSRGGEHVWYVEREGDGWGDPRPLPACVNDMPHHWQISVAANGNLYFHSDRSEPGTGGVYVSRPVDGEYTEPEFLGITGGSPFIAPDESYLITVEAFGRDNVLRVRRDDGSWGDPVSINEFMPGATGVCPRISPDERAYFFLNGRLDAAADFWVDAGFLDEWKRLASLPGGAVTLVRAAHDGGTEAVARVITDIGARPHAYYVSEMTLNGAGYRLLGDELADAAILVLALNVTLYPESANVYDSLGEAYMTVGRNAEAAANYRRSLELNPENVNAAAMLERLADGGEGAG